MQSIKRGPSGPLVVEGYHNPFHLLESVAGEPNIDFKWHEVHGKRRLIGHPNKPMRQLHELFRHYLEDGIREIDSRGGYELRKLPSSTAFVAGSNPLQNAWRHRWGRYFYLLDLWNAYPSVDLDRLAQLLVFIKAFRSYEVDYSFSMLGRNPFLEQELRADPLCAPMLAFLETYCAGLYGKGLAVGGLISPQLFNWYCEVYLDAPLREVCGRYELTYTRYADDCTFSRTQPVISKIREEIRCCVKNAGFSVNHRKSHVLARPMGTVFVTKIGLRGEGPKDTGSAILVFSKKKRRRLHGIIGSYLKMQMDWPEKVSGLIAEFLHYYKNVRKPTKTDQKTFALCKKFEAVWTRKRLHRR